MTLPDSKTYPKPPGQQRPLPKPNNTGKVQYQNSSHGLTGETAYEIYGDLNSDKVPLIALHGGPTFPHPYLRPLSLLCSDYDVPVVLYDQIGCGESTHFPDRQDDVSLWCPELFMDELNNLIQSLGIKAFDLLGHSWGGMLAAQYITTMQPKGLRKLIIADSLAAIHLWQKVARQLLSTTPSDIQETIRRCEKEERYDAPEYVKAIEEFNARHMCRLDPPPKELTDSYEAFVKNMSIAELMFGKSDWNASGLLKDWTIEPQLKNLTPEVVPGGILLVNGQFEIGSDECMQPFFREATAKVKWVHFALSAHMPHLEETESFLRALGDFLQN